MDTVDPATNHRVWPPADDWNEWGFLDYGEAGLARHSYNAYLQDVTDRLPSYDATYSVSVIEHLRADDRRRLLTEMNRVTKAGALTVLTVDVDQGVDTLWNRNLGKEVELKAAHGNFHDLIAEVESCRLSCRGYRCDSGTREILTSTSVGSSW